MTMHYVVEQNVKVSSNSVNHRLENHYSKCLLLLKILEGTQSELAFRTGLQIEVMTEYLC